MTSSALRVSTAALLALLGAAASASAQDTRTVSEPRFPATCTVLRARLAAPTKVPRPDPTLYVAASGTGDYYSIQRAIDRAPATGAIISIGPGTYRERLVVNKQHIVLQSPYRDPSKTLVVADASSGVTGSTFTTATVEVSGSDFRAENLTFVNEYNRTHEQKPQGSQALALSVWADRAVFRNMRFIGDQDTVYAGSSNCSPPGRDVPAGPDTPSGGNTAQCALTRQYFEDCFIEGQRRFHLRQQLGRVRELRDPQQPALHRLPHRAGQTAAG